MNNIQSCKCNNLYNCSNLSSALKNIKNNQNCLSFTQNDDKFEKTNNCENTQNQNIKSNNFNKEKKKNIFFNKSFATIIFDCMLCLSALFFYFAILRNKKCSLKTSDFKNLFSDCESFKMPDIEKGVKDLFNLTSKTNNQKLSNDFQLVDKMEAIDEKITIKYPKLYKNNKPIENIPPEVSLAINIGKDNNLYFDPYKYKQIKLFKGVIEKEKNIIDKSTIRDLSLFPFLIEQLSTVDLKKIDGYKDAQFCLDLLTGKKTIKNKEYKKRAFEQASNILYNLAYNCEDQTCRIKIDKPKEDQFDDFDYYSLPYSNM